MFLCCLANFHERILSWPPDYGRICPHDIYDIPEKQTHHFLKVIFWEFRIITCRTPQQKDTGRTTSFFIFLEMDSSLILNIVHMYPPQKSIDSNAKQGVSFGGCFLFGSAVPVNTVDRFRSIVLGLPKFFGGLQCHKRYKTWTAPPRRFSVSHDSPINKYPLVNKHRPWK